MNLRVFNFLMPKLKMGCGAIKKLPEIVGT